MDFVYSFVSKCSAMAMSSVRTVASRSIFCLFINPLISEGSPFKKLLRILPGFGKLFDYGFRSAFDLGMRYLKRIRITSSGLILKGSCLIVSSERKGDSGRGSLEWVSNKGGQRKAVGVKSVLPSFVLGTSYTFIYIYFSSFLQQIFQWRYFGILKPFGSFSCQVK